MSPFIAISAETQIRKESFISVPVSDKPLLLAKLVITNAVFNSKHEHRIINTDLYGYHNNSYFMHMFSPQSL